MKVLKFGGTSVGSAAAIRSLVEIVRSNLDDRVVVVVSALSGVTDVLYRIVSNPATREDDLRFLRQRHEALASELGVDSPDIQPLADLCMGQSVLTDRQKAGIVSMGELLSSRLVCSVLNKAGIPTQWADVRTMMVATGDPLKSEPDMDEICERVPEAMAEAFAGGASVVITQGFICASSSGKPAVLGRGGSDYSASIIAMALNADQVQIWTDVCGVRTADPRRVPTTRCLERISYDQAAEMAHFGAKVLHPLTLEPAREKDIPVLVLNTNDPCGERTEIVHRDMVSADVKSIAYKENILVITMMSRQAMDSSGFLKKVFDVFSDQKVAVDMVSTNNMQVSVTVDAAQKNLSRAINALQEFAEVVLDRDKAQISAIGSSASCMNSILRMTFAPLRDCKIYMISPGASFVNISFVVDRQRLDEVLQQTHKYLIENESGN